MKLPAELVASSFGKAARASKDQTKSNKEIYTFLNSLNKHSFGEKYLLKSKGS